MKVGRRTGAALAGLISLPLLIVAHAQPHEEEEAISSKILGLLVAVIALCFGSSATATSLSIVGTPTYSINGTNLSFDSRVQNTSSTSSLALRVEMWAVSAPYTGASVTGYRLATSPVLSELSAHSVRTWSQSGPFTPPPAGTWYLTLVWTERDLLVIANEGFRPSAWYNFEARVFLDAAHTLAVPTNLIGRTISPTEATLRWDRSLTPIGVSAATYQIYSGGTFIGSVTGPAASITNLAPSTTYRYSIAACDAQSNCSGQTPTITVTTFAAGSPSVANFTGLWWNSEESGWGINVSHQGNITFATVFTYDPTGSPMWLVMSNGSQQGSSTVFVGDLYIANGPAFYARPFTPITAANITQVGSMTLNFVNSFSGTLTYTVNGALVVKNITKQRFGSRNASCIPTSSNRIGLTNYQDLWWNANESGWGLNITHQDDTLFATLFTYDATGKGLWLVASNGSRQLDGSYLSDLYRTRGSAFNAVPFAPLAASDLTKVGTMRLNFTNGITGTLTYIVDGITVTKAITRQEFASPATGCTS